jgi:hypothetical protein
MLFTIPKVIAPLHGKDTDKHRGSGTLLEPRNFISDDQEANALLTSRRVRVT